MNWEIMEGHWQQAKGRLQEEWGALLGDELTVLAGRRAQEAGKLLQRYGAAKAEAESQLRHCQRLYASALQRPALVRARVATSRRTF